MDWLPFVAIATNEPDGAPTQRLIPLHQIVEVQLHKGGGARVFLETAGGTKANFVTPASPKQVAQECAKVFEWAMTRPAAAAFQVQEKIREQQSAGALANVLQGNIRTPGQ